MNHIEEFRYYGHLILVGVHMIFLGFWVKELIWFTRYRNRSARVAELLTEPPGPESTPSEQRYYWYTHEKTIEILELFRNYLAKINFWIVFNVIGAAINAMCAVK